ncbi:MAG: class II aldolase/adducin family protein [Anaerolineaceae bacterium]
MTQVPQGVLQQMQEVGRDLYQLALVTSHGGNLSMRVGHEMWITGTNTMLGRLKERHLSLVSPSGGHEGPPPSSDTVLHSTGGTKARHRAATRCCTRRSTP